MGYLVLIVISIIIIRLVEKMTFRWETVVKYLWKQVYAHADAMAIHLKREDILEDTFIEKHKKHIEFRGKLINSILDYINYIKTEEDENAEEETFGYGRYNFETILMMAKSKPEVFQKLK